MVSDGKDWGARAAGHNRLGKNGRDESPVMRACARYLYKMQQSHPKGMPLRDVVVYAELGSGKLLRASKMSVTVRTLANTFKARPDFIHHTGSEPATWTIDPKSILLKPLVKKPRKLNGKYLKTWPLLRERLVWKDEDVKE